MTLLGTSFSTPKTHHFCYHLLNHNLHFEHRKLYNSLKLSQFPTTHLSNHFKNSPLRCFSQRETQKSLKQEEEKGKSDQQQEIEAYEFERLFSNLNQATLKHEPGQKLYFVKRLVLFGV